MLVLISSYFEINNSHAYVPIYCTDHMLVDMLIISINTLRSFKHTRNLNVSACISTFIAQANILYLSYCSSYYVLYTLYMNTT